MKCEDCKYHIYLNSIQSHICKSRNHKRRTVRISQEDAERDMDCKWADKVGDTE